MANTAWIEFRRIGENMVVDSLIDNSSGDWNNKL